MFHQGSMVALVTPMLEDGSVDKPALADLVEWHIESGTDAIVAVGTTGESSTLSVSEHADTIQQVVNLVHKRIPVIAGTGGNATAEAIELTEHAAEVGADACLLVTPYYNKPTQEGLYQHFKAVASAVSIPQTRTLRLRPWLICAEPPSLVTVPRRRRPMRRLTICTLFCLLNPTQSP